MLFVAQVLELAPDSAKGYFRLGTALLHLDRAPEAVAALQRAVQHHPHHSQLAAALAAAQEADRAAKLSWRSASLTVRPSWLMCPA